MQSQLPSLEPWIASLEKWQQQLVITSYQLLERERETPAGTVPIIFADYSFIVFPMAKAYEGYLKSFLVKHELLSQEVFASRRFRIGRALNPDVSPPQRNEQWLYDDVVQGCGQEIAQQLWKTWLECRNHVFHYFPGHEKNLTLEQAEVHLQQMADAIQASQACPIKSQSEGRPKYAAIHLEDQK